MGNEHSDSPQETEPDFNSLVTSMSIFAALENKETKKACKLLSKNSDYFKHPNRRDHVTHLLVYTTKSDLKKKEKIMEILFSFLKFEDKEKEYIDAIYEGNVQLVKLFLQSGMNLKDSEWKQELMVNWIFLRKNISVRKEMLELHLEFGLDPYTYQNQYNRNLLGTFVNHVKANDWDAVEIAKILLNFELSVDDFDNVGFSPLFTSINNQNIQLIKLFIKKGADLNKKNGSEQFPLLHAAKYDNKELFKLLVSNGADVTAMDQDGQTALHEACHNTSTQVVSLLIRKGADIRARNDYGETPLSEFINFIYQGKDYQQCLLAMIKGFAKQCFENFFVTDDIILIEKNEVTKKLFYKCLCELDQMTKIKFYLSYTCYSVLNMSNKLRNLVTLTVNKEFVKNFKANFENFPYYKNDLLDIFQEACQLRDEAIIVRFRLSYIFKDIFPDTVIRKLSENLRIEDVPLE